MYTEGISDHLCESTNQSELFSNQKRNDDNEQVTQIVLFKTKPINEANEGAERFFEKPCDRLAHPVSSSAGSRSKVAKMMRMMMVVMMVMMVMTIMIVMMM